MEDPFMSDAFASKRLLKEWNAHGKIIIAFDFDNTVFDYAEAGYTYPKVIELLQKCKELGAYIYCFTAREDSSHDMLNDYIKNNNIPCDGINIDYDFIPFEKGRKPYYNILLDDRAGLGSAYKTLEKAYNNRYKKLYPKTKIEYKKQDDYGIKYITRGDYNLYCCKTPKQFAFENIYASFPRVIIVPSDVDFNVTQFDFDNNPDNYHTVIYRKQKYLDEFLREVQLGKLDTQYGFFND